MANLLCKIFCCCLTRVETVNQKSIDIIPPTPAVELPPPPSEKEITLSPPPPLIMSPTASPMMSNQVSPSLTPSFKRMVFRKKKLSQKNSLGHSHMSPPALAPFPADKKWRILVVDDSAVCRKSTARILKLHEHYVDEADDGIECIFLVQLAAEYYEEPYHAMICDDDMPNMTGHEATKVLRAKGYDDLKIIGLTGNKSDDILQNFRNCGADIVVRKPLTEEIWLRIYNSLIKEEGEPTGGPVGSP
jgi:CheY-like chemotaxis protein